MTNIEYLESADDANKPIKSDGGSSDYYFTKLPKEVIDDIVKRGGIEFNHIQRYVYDNDNDASNITKAQKRIIEAKKGRGKEGIDVFYDNKKSHWFLDVQRKALEIEFGNKENT